MKYFAIFLVSVFLMLISCVRKEQSCTTEKIMAIKQKDSSVSRYVDGICLDESRVAILRQVRNELGDGIGVIELGFFDSSYHAIKSFNTDSSFWDIMNSIAVKDSTLYIAATSYLFTVDMDGKNSNFLASLNLGISNYSASKRYGHTHQHYNLLHPVEMTIRNDSIIIDVGELDYPNTPSFGRIVFDGKMHPSTFMPDSVCVEINFPDGRVFSHGACTAESWLNLHNLKELPLKNHEDTCRDNAYDSTWNTLALDTTTKWKSPEEFESIIKRISHKIDSQRMIQSRKSEVDY